MSTTPTLTASETTDQFFETEAQEARRLAEDPETAHLADLPVRTRTWPQDLLIELPRTEQIVVVPLVFTNAPLTMTTFPQPRWSGEWDCVIVHSEDPEHPVGSEHITVTAVEIARGTQVAIEGTGPPF